MPLPDFFPKTDQALDIGGPNGPLLVGQSFDRTYSFVTFVSGEECGNQPVDFTGYNMIAEVVAADQQTVLETFSVTPMAGDATGSFDLHLDPSQVTESLRDNASKWKFRMVDGGTTNELLILANFRVT